MFVMTLCFSRRAYYQLVPDQKVPSFLAAIRAAFEHFGVVPQRLKLDNLKSGVLRDHLGQRYYQDDFYRFCQHYGCLPDAARPYTPTDKGRVERDIRYAKGSCFRGREFDSREHAAAHLREWMEQVADRRVHGTTQRRPIDLFAEEVPHLRPLPEEPFECATWAHYRVQKDSHFKLRDNYYSVPHRFVGRKLLVRVGERDLTVFSDSEVVAIHEIAQGKGLTITHPSHLPAGRRTATQEVHRRRVKTIRSGRPACRAVPGEAPRRRLRHGRSATETRSANPAVRGRRRRGRLRESLTTSGLSTGRR